MAWKMFLIQRAPYARRSLRRFWRSPYGVHKHFHDASVVIDPQFDCPGDDNGRAEGEGLYKGDPRWPTACACGYAFTPEDHYQTVEDRLWSGCPDGKLYVLREHPPGATWIADWFSDEGPNGQYTGPDGKVWCVMLPAGVEFLLYSHCSGTPRRKWSVEGTPPLVNVSPSINQEGEYHGFIGLPHGPAPGIITDDCEGRKFPKWPPTA